MKTIEVFRSVNKEYAQAVAKAIYDQFPVKCVASIVYTEDFTEYKVNVWENKCSYNKRDFHRWADGYIFGKFGE